jgi:diacylglycerol kinase family enzyme
VRLSLIVNPAASSVTRRARIVIQKALSADHDLEVTETSRSGQAIRLAHGAARDGADVILALGGDGTINEVANGVLGEACAIAPLPGGSTNVFARAVGFPNDAIEATGVLLEALAAGTTRTASVGLANGRAFLFNVGAGFDAMVVDKVEQRGPLKRYLGYPYFVASTFAAWFGDADRHRPRFSVLTDDGLTVDGAQLAIAMNCTPYTYLGTSALHLAPEAGLDRPLSVVVLTSLSPRMIPILLRSLRNPDGLPDRGATRHWRNIEGLTISSPRPFPYQMDGEAMDEVTELRLLHRADAIRLVVPATC